MPDMSAHQALVQLVPLAKELDENKVTPGVLGFIVFAVMALAVWALMKSMNRHMKRVDFEETPEDASANAAASSDARTPAASGTGSAGAGETTK
ncbi:hypothetical protein C6N75_08500 [Streptomyces solincola]|uniref:Uncharacterized protein n=1 Tax=Streptomyces solincola TaxID=2100817 RepID=A0A2S9PZ35_9ACTN|nr:hypothetical protein [Streptomyces solincola]PRH79613.1 hypothetical protein C6N75_08500 [Streptomyces solincola]